MTARVLACLLACLLPTAAVVTGCGTANGKDAGIVVTTNILGDVTRNIVGDEAAITVLMKPDADPHSFGISAREAAQMERAGLIVYNGLGLEEGVLHHVEAAAAQHVSTLAVAEAVDPITFSDATELPDPHFWTDPRRVRAAVETIADRVVTEVDGVDPERIRDNAARYAEQLQVLDTDMDRRFGTIARDRRKLVTNHHVFGYLARRFGFDVIGTVLPSGTTLASPSASDLRDLADTIRAAGVPVVFADTSHSDRIAQVLADEAGLKVAVVPLYSESLGRPGTAADTYLAMMRANTDDIVRHLHH